MVSAAVCYWNYPNNSVCPDFRQIGLNDPVLSQCLKRISLQAFFNSLNNSVDIMCIDQRSAFIDFPDMPDYIPGDAASHYKLFFRIVLSNLLYLLQRRNISLHCAYVDYIDIRI